MCLYLITDMLLQLIKEVHHCLTDTYQLRRYSISEIYKILTVELMKKILGIFRGFPGLGSSCVGCFYLRNITETAIAMMLKSLVIYKVISI